MRNPVLTYVIMFIETTGSAVGHVRHAVGVTGYTGPILYIYFDV